VEALDVSRRIYQGLASLSAEPILRVRTWTGEVWGPSDSVATLVLRHPGAFRALLVPPSDLAAGEAYLCDDVDVEGDMAALLGLLARLEDNPHSWLGVVKLVRLARQLPSEVRRTTANRPTFQGRRHSPQRDRRAVTYHYDTGNDFFALFLDPSMVYSCGYFLTDEEPLAKAQERKLDLICRKLELRPGDRFLDVGCGWGALVTHAAAHYGVAATGVTLSGPQAELAERRVKELELEDRVTIRQSDYRDVIDSFDAMASVGMFEHVGRAELSAYFESLKRLLTPGGRLLNHGIVTRDRSRRPLGRSFMNTYAFPDGELMPVEETIGIAEQAGFELRDAESLRASYALTLRRWVTNLEANAAEAVGIAGEWTYRLWRLYMAGSAVAFERAKIGVYQLLLADPGRGWTHGRRHLLAFDDQE
jgi:cyclopropane-fatty-acyl-phospholipid synthase